MTGEESSWEERGEAKRSANSSIRPQPARIALTVGLEEASERRTGDGLIVTAAWEVKRRRDGSMGPPPSFGTFGTFGTFVHAQSRCESLARVRAHSRGAESFVHLIFSIAIIISQRGGRERRRCGAEWIEQKKPFPHAARFTMG